MLEKGIRGHREITVAEQDTAQAFKSGTLPVFATPAMAALAEETAWRSVAGELEEGMATVGTSLSLKHLSATPTGMKVVCDTELVEADGRRLVFTLEVWDETGKVGEGMHERFIIQEDKFLAKAEAKREAAGSSAGRNASAGRTA